MKSGKDTGFWLSFQEPYNIYIHLVKGYVVFCHKEVVLDIVINGVLKKS